MTSEASRMVSDVDGAGFVVLSLVRILPRYIQCSACGN